MRFWWRELGGWFLIGLGLLCFGVVWRFCKQHYVLESVPMTFIGMILFWGGINLLKVAIAARVCQQAQEGWRVSERVSERVAGGGWRVEGGRRKPSSPSTLHPPPATH